MTCERERAEDVSLIEANEEGKGSIGDGGVGVGQGLESSSLCFRPLFKRGVSEAMLAFFQFLQCLLTASIVTSLSLPSSVH